MPSHRFHIGDVLSITTKRMFSPRGMLGIRGILAFISGSGGPNDTSITDIGCVVVTPRCAEELIRQHPWLENVDISNIPERDWQDYINDLITEHGEFLEVSSIN